MVVGANGSCCCSIVDDSVAPLTFDYSYFQSHSNSYSVEDVWDGENVNSDNVSEWVASKLKKASPPVLG